MIDKETLLLGNDVVSLRPLQVKDITDEYINGLNNPEVNRYLINVRIERQTRESVEKFINFNWVSPTNIFLGIFVKDNSEPFVGTVRVSGIDLFHYTASVGICLFARRAWKKGYALNALQLVKDYLFSVAGLHYIEAGIHWKNTNSINLFSRAGFTEWYRVKNKIRYVNSFEETIFFATVNPSFDLSLLKKDTFSEKLRK